MMIEAEVYLKAHTHKRTGRPPRVQRFAPSLSEREGHGRLWKVTALSHREDGEESQEGEAGPRR